MAHKLSGIAYALAMGEKLEESLKNEPDLSWKERVEKASEEVRKESPKKA